MDSSSLSLSLVETEGAADLSAFRSKIFGIRSPTLLDFQRSLTEDEKFDMHEEVKKANPGVTTKELVAIKRATMLKAALEARKRKSQDAKDSSLSSPLTGMDNEEKLLVRGPAQRALVDEFRLSLTDAQGSNIYAEVREANPDEDSIELAKALRAATLRAALEARRKKIRDEKDPSRSLPLSAGSVSETASSADVRSKDVSLPLLHLGTVKAASPLSLRAQPKSDASLQVKPYSLSLTKEERAPVFAATKLANPDADRKALTWHTELLCGKQTARKEASILAATWMQWISLFFLKQIVRIAVERTQTPQRMGCRSLGMTY